MLADRSFSILLVVGLFGCKEGGGESSDHTQGLTIEGDGRCDFGMTIEGSEPSHEFVLANLGGPPAVVRAIRSDCGCVATSATVCGVTYDFGSPIDVGARLVVRVSLATVGRRGDLKATSRITIEQGGEERIVELLLMCHIMPVFDVQPAVLELGNLRVGSTWQGQVFVTSSVLTNFHLSVERPDHGVGVVAAVASPEPTSSLVDVSFSAGASPTSNFFSLLRLVATDVEPENLVECLVDDVWTVRVPVKGRIVGFIATDPEYASFGIVAKGESRSTEVSLKSYDAAFTLALGMEDIRIETVTGNALVRVTPKTRAGGVGETVLDIQVDTRAETSSGPFRALVHLAVRHPRQETHSFPVFGVIR